MADLVKVICVIVKESLPNIVRFSMLSGIGITVSEKAKRINYF
jgi:nitrate/nitrite-specific signal transduction histidine kinase